MTTGTRARTHTTAPVLLGGALLLALAASPSAAQERGADDPHAHCRTKPAAEAAKSAARPMPAQPAIGEIALVDQDGRETTLRDALEAEVPVLVNFIFTTCTTICPVMSTGFSQLLKDLGPARDQVRLVSISVDPDNDSVDAIRRYADRYGAGDEWRLLTGSREASIAAQRAFGAYRGDKMNHSPSTYVRAGRGEPWQVVDGLSSAKTLQDVWRSLAHAGVE